MDRKQWLSEKYIEHYAALRQYALRQTGDPFLAEDLVDEAFMLALARLDALMEHENPAGWLFKTVRLLAKDELRLAYRRMEVPLEDGLGLSSAEHRSLSDALPRGLNERDRELLLLRFEQGLDHDALAARRGVTNAAIRKQLSRALERCRRLMEQEQGGVEG